MTPRRAAVVLAALALASTAVTAAVASAATASPSGTRASGTAAAGSVAARAVTPAAVPRPDHIVLVMFENKKYSQINGASSAPYLNSLAASGAKFTGSFAITHPSQPNYIALFSGSTQGVTSDACPHNYTSSANLGAQLIGAGLTFTGYSESMPSNGYTGCSSGNYARKHNSWVDFSTVPAADNLTFAKFPTDFTKLPTVAFVSPNLCSDMHDCSIATGDTWMQNHMSAYATWAKTHNSLLITTFDEDSGSSVNQIFTVFTGQHVLVGSYAEQINHYSILRTIEDAFGLSHINNAASATTISDCWH